MNLEEKQKHEEEKKKQQELSDKEWRRKVKSKYEKEEKRRHSSEKQKQLSQHWGMLRRKTHTITPKGIKYYTFSVRSWKHHSAIFNPWESPPPSVSERFA